MTFMIAAAGTGGHVYPGLSVAEALLEMGVSRADIAFVGGSRLESRVYPENGFPFLEVELRGLKRSMTLQNLTLPLVVLKAKRRIEEAINSSGVKAMLGMGGYVTIPAGLAARKRRVPFFNSEQNAVAGLANRVSASWTEKSFVSFPDTSGIPNGEWVGNPVRKVFWSFDRSELRRSSLERYELDPGIPTLGVFGGSLGAGVINDAMGSVLSVWNGPEIQVVHLTGESHIGSLAGIEPARNVVWRRLEFEESMEFFYAASDLVVARAGGAVAELTATATPSILVPGEFGSSGHQAGNAAFLDRSGASVVIAQTDIDLLGDSILRTLFDEGALDSMRHASKTIARPDAALVIAKALMEAV